VAPAGTAPVIGTAEGEGTTMFEKREDRDQGTTGRNGEMAELETARSAAESSSGQKPIEPKKDEEHMSLFWRVFGGTILSIMALVAMTLYNNLTSSISDAHADLNREREARAELVKKADVDSRVTAVYDRLRGLEAVKVELEGLKEKVGTNSVAVDGVKKDMAAAVDGVKKDTAAALEAMKKDAGSNAEAMKKDEAALEILKERVTLVEGVKKDFAGLDTLKERMAAVSTDLKALRDEMTKLSGDVERNRASDLERKSNRDAQYKQVDETLKELQKGLQACREKLARLEGAIPGAERPLPPTSGIAKPTLPATPSEVKPAGGTTPSGNPKPEPELPQGK
jgi:DNA repair exonuclease SbcCD ATPase subunit